MKKVCFCIMLLFCSYCAFCQYDSLKPQGIYSSNFIINEIPRNLLYYMPLNYGKAENYPLVIFLHDKGSNAQSLVKKYSDLIHAKADSFNAVIMYPEGIGGQWSDSVNDAAFLNIMLNFFVQQYHCDANRIYLMGIGDGGDMCHQFYCKTSTKISAMATINASVNKQTYCYQMEKTPVLNLTANTNLTSAISQGFHFLFYRDKPE